MGRKKKRLRISLWIIGAAVSFALAAHLRGVRFLKFPGESMIPAVRPNDTLLVLVGPGYARRVNRFDMLIFDLPANFAADNPAWHKVPWMKRLIGLPGEHVRFNSTGLFVNEQKVALSVSLAGDQPPSIDVHLGADEYFVIGDNLASSIDSRSFGALHGSQVKGYVWTVIRHRG